jgi:hypothetical protein
VNRQHPAQELNLHPFKSHGVYVIPMSERLKVESLCGRYGINIITDASVHEDKGTWGRRTECMETIQHIARPYHSDYVLDAANWSPIATTTANTSSFYDMGLTAATTYYHRVRAFNGGAYTGYTNVATTTTIDNPPLLPRQPEVVAELLSAHSEHHPAHPDPAAHVFVHGVGGHFDRCLFPVSSESLVLAALIAP